MTIFLPVGRGRGGPFQLGGISSLGDHLLKRMLMPQT
jgi:hypothetical protein